MRRLCFLLTALGLPAALPAYAAPAARDSILSAPVLRRRVDQYFGPIMANHDFAGVVLIARGHRILLQRAYGIADPELGTPTAITHSYRIASLTKTFTAAAIAILAERGSLRLTDRLSRFLPAFPNGDSITVQQLLGHAAGLANPDYREGLRDRIDLDGLVARIAALPPLFPPGTDSRYSNAGFNVLARVIEVASGNSYQHFLEANILQPLGMTSTGNFPDDTIVSGRVRGFLPGPLPSGVIPAPWSDVGFNLGSGSLVSTAGDLYRWALAVHTDRLYHKSQFTYPYGWGRLGADRKAGLEQTGLTNGFTSSLALWFADSLYVIVLGNIESAQWTRWSADLSSIARGQKVVTTAGRHEAAVPAGLAERFAGVYRSTDHKVEVQNRRGSLWAILDDWPVPKYLAPVASDSFELRSDFGRVVFDTRGTGPAARMSWIFGPDAQTDYARVSP